MEVEFVKVEEDHQKQTDRLPRLILNLVFEEEGRREWKGNPT